MSRELRTSIHNDSGDCPHLVEMASAYVLNIREVGRRLVVLASDQAGGNDRTWARGDASDDCRAPAGV